MVITLLLKIFYSVIKMLKHLQKKNSQNVLFLSFNKNVFKKDMKTLSKSLKVNIPFQMPISVSSVPVHFTKDLSGKSIRQRWKLNHLKRAHSDRTVFKIF